MSLDPSGLRSIFQAREHVAEPSVGKRSFDEEMASNLIAVAEEFLQEANYIQQRNLTEMYPIKRLWREGGITSPRSSLSSS